LALDASMTTFSMFCVVSLRETAVIRADSMSWDTTFVTVSDRRV
jgi:hypothetical protein